MSDLISRSELIKYFEAIQQEENVVGLKFVAAIDEIKGQPTAYDVDKVVEQLEKAKHEIASEDYCRSINDKEKCDGRDCFECCAEYLIEIVKQGGVSDDTDNMCECRRLKGYNFIFKTSCGDVFDMKSGFKHCPYCGKKIKVIQNDN